MAGIPQLNGEPALLVPEARKGEAVPRDPALGGADPEPSRNAHRQTVSSLAWADRPLTEAGGTEWPGPDIKDQPAFRVTISPTASRLARQAGREGSPAEPGPTEDGEPSRGRELSEAGRRDVDELREQDRRVRRHEQAHVAAGGRAVRGGARYEYTVGPDGRRYATGGEVPIDLGAEKDPRDTIQKMNTVRRAALAPADPSAADRAVAASASRKAAEARRQLSQARKPDSPGDSGTPGGVGRDKALVQEVGPGSSSSRTEDQVDSTGPPGETADSVPEPSVDATLRTGLLRALSRVTAPPAQSSGRIDRYA